MLLLCSDGLSGPVAADAIRVALTRSDPQAAAERLILEARRQGGPDNITAVVVRVDEAPHGALDDEETTLVQPADRRPTPRPASSRSSSPATRPLDEDEVDAADALAALRAEQDGEAAPASEAVRRRRRSVRRLGIVAAVLALVVVALAAGAFCLSTVFFIGVDGGSLAIYSGVPGKIGPIPLHAVYRRSYVTYDSLSPAARTLVDEQKLRDKASALSVSRQLGMWP